MINRFEKAVSRPAPGAHELREALLGVPLVGLLGAGGQAREIRSYLPVGTDAFMAVDARYLGTEGVEAIDIENPPHPEIHCPVMGAVGAPGLRRRLLTTWPGSRYFSHIAPSAHVDPGCQVGEGVIIAPGVVITTGVSLGAHTQINVAATISHDCTLGTFVTVGPGAHLGGQVSVADGCFIGMGANIAPRVSLASGVVVGAGATVLHDVLEPNAVVAGVPAQKIGVNEEWLDVL